jgi:hypothetical protein
MKLIEMTKYVELDKTRLLEHIRLLTNRRLIRKGNFGGNEDIYFVTKRGLKVLKVISPIIKEAQKIQMRNFEAITSVLSGAKVNPEIKKEKKRKWKFSDFIKVEILKTEDKQKPIF